MTRDELVDDIRSELGEPVVRVELDDTHFDKIIKAAKRWFRRKKGVIAMDKLAIVEGQSEYDKPANCDKLIEVILPGNRDIFHLTMGLTDDIPSWLFGPTAGSFLPSDSSHFVQFLTSLETRKRIFSAESGWFEKHGKIYISGSPGCGRSGGKAIIVYTQLEFDWELLKGSDEDVFYRWCKAKSKDILGEIRGKYPSYPAAGGPISMNADTLKAEAKEEMDQLEIDIIGSQGNMGMTTG